MPATMKPTIAVLFDHELRAAAAALQECYALLDKKSLEKPEAKQFAIAFQLAHAALFAVRPDVHAVTVVNLKELAEPCGIQHQLKDDD